MKDQVLSFLKNKNNFVVVALAGVLLFVIALPTGETGKTGSTVLETEKNQHTDQKETADLTEEDYVVAMEAKLELALSQIEGAGKVKVVITVQSSAEKVVEKDQPVSRSNTQEEDSQGGYRTVSSMDSGESTVYQSENGTSTPYVVKTIQPKVEGVLVIAQGAGTGTVSHNISKAIQVLFDLAAHKITVVKMETP